MKEIKLFDFQDEWCYYCIGIYPLDANTIVSQIESAKDEELLVRINSGGGYVFDGWAIYNALINHPKKVTVRIEGIAASIASIIAMAGQEVTMMKGSLMMIHKPSTFSWGDADAEKLKKEAEVLDKIQEVLVDLYVDKTGLDEETINQMIDEESWLTPDEAVSLGFADKVQDGKKAVAVMKNMFERVTANAPAHIRAYANRMQIVHKNDNDMNADSKKLLQENKSLLTKVVNFFKKAFEIKDASSELADGTVIYYEGDLAVGTAVFSDEGMTAALADGDYELADARTITVADGAVTAIAGDEDDAQENEADTGQENDTEIDPENATEVEDLQQQIADLEAENTALRNQLDQSNKTLKKLQNIKSKYQPDARQQNFRAKKDEKKSKEDYLDEMQERKNQYRKGKAAQEK